MSLNPDHLEATASAGALVQDEPAEELEDLPSKESQRLAVAPRQSVAVTTLRWIAVLPAALAAFAIIQLLIIFADATMAEGHANWYLQLVNSFAGAYAFVFAGAHTAPRYQYTVGIVLAVLAVIFMSGLLYLAYSIKTTDPWWWLALASAISIVAVVAAVSQLKEDKWQLK